MFRFWGSQGEQAQPGQSPSALSSRGSSRPATPSNSNSLQRPADRTQSLHVSPSEAAEVITLLKDKSVDDLRKLLSDKDAYQRFLHSLDQVKTQNNIKDELRKETMQLARENLEKEPQIIELRNQCRIIWTTELAAAQEKLNELERKKAEMLRSCSPVSLLYKLQEAMNKTEDESEILHRQLLGGEIDLTTFVQKHKKLRTSYHRQALIHLAAKTSIV